MSEKNYTETKYCQKCGCEISIDSKYKECANCRRKKADHINKFIRFFGVVFGGAVLLKKYSDTKPDDLEEDESDNDIV